MGIFNAKTTCTALAIVVVILVIIIAFSFHVIEPNNVGIRYNLIDQKIDEDKMYESGRMFLGPSQKMIIFPKTQQTRDLGILMGRSKGKEGGASNLATKGRIHSIPFFVCL